MRFLIVAVCSLLLHAGSASALISLDHQDDTGGSARSIGETFSVDVIATYDANPDVAGLFVSSGWDPTEIELISVTEAPFAIFPGPQGSLTRFGSVIDSFNRTAFPDDPDGTVRSVQFGALPNALPSAGPAVLITTLTFQVLSAGDGTATIDFLFNVGDIIFAAGCVAAGEPICGLSPSEVQLGSATITIIPEPGTALLLGLGLIGLTTARLNLERRGRP